MTALLRYDASGVPQILHNQPAFLNSQDAVLTVFGDGDQIAGFPVADGEFHGAEAEAGLGFELVPVQHPLLGRRGFGVNDEGVKAIQGSLDPAERQCLVGTGEACENGQVVAGPLESLLRYPLVHDVGGYR